MKLEVQSSKFEETGAQVSDERRNGAPRDIGERAHAFAVRIVRLVNAMPRTLAGASIARQLIRAGTSIGANVHEARGSSSRKEYSRRMKIARSEAQETFYWIRLLGESDLFPKRRLAPLLQEADELIRILAAIGKKTESKAGKTS
jgi:four helix bundle protein